MTINETSGNDSIESLSTVMPSSVKQEHNKIQEPTVSSHEPTVSSQTKSKSSIKITKIQPSSSTKTCHVDLNQVAESNEGNEIL